jgi:hypothetical protein
MGLAEDIFGGEVPEEYAELRDALNALDRCHYTYKLVDGEPVECGVLEGALALGADRKINYTELENCAVSTVFLVLNHSSKPDKPPILFETMIIGGHWENRTYHYRTMGDAKQGHWQIVECLRQGRPPEITPEIDADSRDLYTLLSDLLRGDV